MAGVTWNRWLRVLRAGTWTGKNIKTGQPETVTYSLADLDTIVARQVASNDPVPVVIGHPSAGQTSPSWGWASRLRRVGDMVEAFVGEVDSAFAAGVAARHYQHRSCGVARDTVGPRITHIGFLGASAPAMEGLGALDFSAGDGVDLPMEDSMKTIEELERELEQERAARKAQEVQFSAALAGHTIELRKRDTAEYTKKLVDAGQLPPALRSTTETLLFSLSDEHQVDVPAADGKGTEKVGLRSLFQRHLDGLAEGFKGLFKPAAGADTDPGRREAVAFGAPAGVDLPIAGLDLDAKAKAYAANHKVSYEAGLAAVMRGAA